MKKEKLKSSNFVVFLPKIDYLRGPREPFFHRGKIKTLERSSKNFLIKFKRIPSLRQTFIVDLRNNGGGAAKLQEKYYQADFRAYSQTGKSLGY